MPSVAPVRLPAARHRPAKSRERATVGILGAGYMGLATGVAFAGRGLRVYAYDVNPEVRATLRRGRSPYREEGLGELVRETTRRGQLVVVDRVEELAARASTIFICLPTPSRRSGGIDLRPLRRGVAELGRALRPVAGYRVAVVKSTVVPGTTERVLEPLLRRRSGRTSRDLGVVSNPEFLAEGRMVRDALRPSRIVLGARDRRAIRQVASLYRGFGAPAFELAPSDAELVKYASNAFLALKVSFANEVGRLAERLGGNIDEVMAATGADPRIGSEFLRAGPGFGGSCFRKDLRAIVERSRALGERFRSGETALAINEDQVQHALRLARAAGPLRGATVAVLGLAFKAGTDDVRESRAFPLVDGLLRHGAKVRAHDPVALENFRRAWDLRPGRRASRVTYCTSVERALRGADLAILHTDWPLYSRWPGRWSRAMRTPNLVDLRRGVPPRVQRRAGLRVIALGVGHGPVPRERRGSMRRARADGRRR
jgi:UDPglucose 6-dehydrogenase